MFQRLKEEAHDYRYFPEPDLVPVVLDDAALRRISESIGELPAARESRYTREHGLAPNEAAFLTSDRAIGKLFERALAEGGDARRCALLLMGRGSALANQRGCPLSDLAIDAGGLAQIARLQVEGRILSRNAARLFDRMVEEGASPLAVAEQEGLLITVDMSAIQDWVDRAVADNPQAGTDVLSGSKKQKKALSFLVGQVMQKAKGTAPPQEVQRLIREKLGL